MPSISNSESNEPIITKAVNDLSQFDLTHSDLPPLFRASDASSTEAQAWFLWSARLRLMALMAAALFGLFTWRKAPSPVDIAGVAAASCFVVALIVELYVQQTKPERTWYEARAAAESVKTLSWRYAVGGEPFNIDGRTKAQIDQMFLDQLNTIFDVIKDLDLKPPSSGGEQISVRMRQMRALSFGDRKAAYDHGRTASQQEWYGQRALWNKRRARLWTVATLAVEIFGVVAGILKAVGYIEGDLLGFAGAAVATVTAWLQTKQHRTLATAYTVTSLELASVRSKIAHQHNEEDWARFVSDAEEAFSREHTLWKSSHRAH